jgi:hypothetical protein
VQGGSEPDGAFVDKLFGLFDTLTGISFAHKDPPIFVPKRQCAIGIDLPAMSMGMVMPGPQRIPVVENSQRRSVYNRLTRSG